MQLLLHDQEEIGTEIIFLPGEAFQMCRVA
jgi:hypothetical protein